MMHFGVMFFAAMAAAQPASVLRAGFSLVHVDAEVIAADGRILKGFPNRIFVSLTKACHSSSISRLKNNRSI